MPGYERVIGPFWAGQSKPHDSVRDRSGWEADHVWSVREIADLLN
jgi:hypothetical protein